MPFSPESSDVPWEDGDDDLDEGPDPAMVAFLDQEGEQFNNSAAQFAQTFGFEHKCTCAQDYTNGKLAETTHCFGRLCQDAMNACKELKKERDMLFALIQSGLQEKDA